MTSVGKGMRHRTRFTERKVFRSSIHVKLGGSRSRSIDEGSGSVEFHVDPGTKKLVNTALGAQTKEKSPEFVSKPKRQFVNEGESAKFKAQIDGAPSTVLSWSLNGTALAIDNKHKIYTEKDVHILELPKVSEKDQGTYECKIENPSGSATASAELEVFVRPKSQTGKSSMFVSPTVDIPLEDTEFADKEKNATLVCKFHNGIDGTAKWYKDGKELGSWQAKTTFDGRSAKLVLREASKRVCGVYECVVKNSGGEAKSKALVSLLDSKVKPSPPKFTLTLNDQAIEEGEKLVLETEVTGKPRPSLKWYKDNEELGSSQDIRMEFREGKGRLIVDNLDLTEGSKFTCVAKNIAGEDQTMASVSGSADAREPPIFTKELQDMEASDGERVEMSVEVKGTPPIDIVWVHNNREIPPNDPVCRMITKGNTHMLVIPEVFPEDSGEYVCEAYNDYGDTDTFCRLNVHEEKDVIQNISQKAPEFAVNPQNVHIEEETSTILSCQVIGNPPPSVQWSRGRQILKHGHKYKVSSVGDEHFLEVTSGTLEDSGQYTCTLCNPVGTTSATCQISVGDKGTSQSTSHHHRSHQKIRSLRDHSLRHNGTDSESSDISSISSEAFQPAFAVKTNSELFYGSPSASKTNSESFYGSPSASKTNSESFFGSPSAFKTNSGAFYGTQSAFKTISEPSNGIQSVKEVVISPKNRTQLNRNPLEIDKRRNVDVLQRRPVEKELSNASTVVHSDNIKKENSVLSNIGGNKSHAKFPEPVIEKKGGVTQVDFRGVLRHKHSSRDSGVGDLNGHSAKHVNDVDSHKLNSDDFKKVLSPKRQVLDQEVNKTLPNCVQIVKPSESKKSSKVNEALKRFEDNTTSVQSDFRNVLKSKKETAANNKENDQLSSKLDTKAIKAETADRDTVSHVDFRNVLKKTETATVSVHTDNKKVKQDHIVDQLSDSSFEKKSIQKQRAELVVNVRTKSTDRITTPKQKKEFDFTKTAKQESPVKSEFKKGNKLELDLPVVKPNTGSFEARPVEFRSVLAKPERRNSRDLSADILKPIPRRLSQSKSLIMDSKPEVKEKLENKSVEYGSEVTLQCHVTGNPEPELSWSINDKEIKQSKFFRMSYKDERAKLVIAEAFSEDEGEYTCTATNPAGSTKTTCRLQIQERPSTPENTVDTLEEPFSPTATPPKIYNVCPAEICILRGSMVEFKASFTSVPPGTVTWLRGKQEIQTDDKIRIETSDCVSTLTVVDIHPEDSGRFDVKVENKLGADMAFASLTVEDVPEAPVGQPWVSEVALTAATLSWYGPAYDGGCPVTSYRIELCDAEDQEWTLVTSKCLSTTYRITKLQAHTPYFFRVFAENKHGLSKPCMTPEVTVTSDRRPSALLRLPSTESDDVFMHETSDLLTPMSAYGIVSPLSPDEISFEHREVTVLAGRGFENFYNCLEEVGKGKFGSVYKCEEKLTGKIWAAKVLKCRESEKKKIQLEVEIMNKLKHPKILMLWDVFEAPRKMVLVMEYIGGGELFERVIDDGFELTERDCIQFMRQICDAVHYMHSRNILHLDLKPENILCIKNESNKVKIIDFGLARYYNKGESVRVLFGTPEFIAPEVVNYDEIGFTTDMWSVGVICYVLLTGLSPFMGDSDAETLSNVTHGEFDFEEEEFDSVSDDGKNFIEKMLVKNKNKRLISLQALEHPWLANDAARMKNHRINTKNLKKFMARRKWQKTGNAIRALGRMKNSLQKIVRPYRSPCGSLSSASGVGSSSSGSSMSSMGSQNTISDVINASTPLKVNAPEDMSPTIQNSGKFESTNHNQESKTSPKERKLQPTFNHGETKSNINGKHVDINLNLTSRNKSAFVRSNSSEKGVDTVHTKSPANLCYERRSGVMSSQNGREDSKTPCYPKFTKEMVDSKAFPGDVVRFDVAFNADKTTKVHWYFEDELITEDEQHCVQNSNDGNCSLIIKDVCEDDDGDYSCKIVNNFGEESCSAELIVYGAL